MIDGGVSEGKKAKGFRRTAELSRRRAEDPSFRTDSQNGLAERTRSVRSSKAKGPPFVLQRPYVRPDNQFSPSPIRRSISRRINPIFRKFTNRRTK